MSEMTPLEAIRAARQLLSDEKAWFKGGFCGVRDALGRARDTWDSDDGKGVPATLAEATCFCTVGALMKVTNAPCWDWFVERCEEEIEDTLEGMGIDDPVPTFNDDPHTTHAQLMTVLDKTIERLEAQTC